MRCVEFHNPYGNIHDAFLSTRFMNFMTFHTEIAAAHQGPVLYIAALKSCCEFIAIHCEFDEKHHVFQGVSRYVDLRSTYVRRRPICPVHQMCYLMNEPTTKRAYHGLLVSTSMTPLPANTEIQVSVGYKRSTDRTHLARDSNSPQSSTQSLYQLRHQETPRVCRLS